MAGRRHPIRLDCRVFPRSAQRPRSNGCGEARLARFASITRNISVVESPPSGRRTAAHLLESKQRCVERQAGAGGHEHERRARLELGVGEDAAENEKDGRGGPVPRIPQDVAGGVEHLGADGQ